MPKKIPIVKHDPKLPDLGAYIGGPLAPRKKSPAKQ
jgi:hypothetical protein